MASIKLLQSMLEESPLRGGTLIMQAVVAFDSLPELKVDDYQRKVLTLTPRSRLYQAFEKGEVLPAIELGMRGQRYVTRDGVAYLQDDVYILDGLQRVSGAMRYGSLHQGWARNLLATIHFDTTRAWERERFEVLNVARVKMSPNILLRNKREDSNGCNLLYQLCMEDTRFPLQQRVSWEQTMSRNDLITAMNFAKTAIRMHTHIGVGGGGTQNLDGITTMLDRLVESVGARNLQNNINSFYKLIDDCWGIRAVQYRDTATQLRGVFMMVLARVISDHTDFWKAQDRQLQIPRELLAKIKSFPVQDPTVVNLAGSAGKARHMLYTMIVDHINSGKRTRHLSARENLDLSTLEEAA